MNSKEGTGEQPDAEPHVEIQALTEVQISAAGEHGQGDAQECRQEDSGGDHREGPSDPDINDQLQASTFATKDWKSVSFAWKRIF